MHNPAALKSIGRWVKDRAVSPVDNRVPWWSYEAVEAVGARLAPGAGVFEYGSGGSTLWLEDRKALVQSVEHEPGWYEILRPKLANPNVLKLIPPESTGMATSSVEDGFFDAYIDSIDGCPDGSLDMVIVDGRCRILCLRRAAPKVKPGGMLLLDDAERARYAEAFEVLSGWKVERFAGLKVGLDIATTAVFTRPV